MRQKRQMDKLRFLTESRNGKESVIEKLIHKDNSSPNRISCSIAEKSDIKSVMDICFARQQWMTEQGFNYVLNKDNRKYYRHKIEDRKLWVCKQSGVVMGFCVVEDHDINGYWKDFPTDSFVYAHDGMTRPHKSVKETSDYNFIGILINAIIDFYGKGIRFDVLLPNQRLESFYEKELGCNPVKKVIDEDDGSCHLLMEKTNNNPSLTESFTRKISSKKNDELTTKSSFELDDGVYILHETLGVRTVDSWNPKDNEGVVGILLVEDEHKIVVALEDSPEVLPWSKKRGLINQPIEKIKDAESDFNGEVYCQKLNSPDFPAAYYCKTYNKGNRDWYLPSIGELRLIHSHFDEIQNALSIVGGQKFDTNWDEGDPVYWSSTELTATYAWNSYLVRGDLIKWYTKVSHSGKVRPISKFKPSILKESFTRKIRSKKNDELTSKADTAFVPDGVYILHETLGVKGVEGWKPKDNKGVVGILLVEDDHKIVIATEDSPKKLRWSKFRALKQINEPIKKKEDAESDFNGEEHCIKLNSPDFPAAYYCLNYKKGGRNWYLPSTGELWLIYNHLEEIQNALETVGGKKFVTSWDDNLPWYWSSTEESDVYAWLLNLSNGNLYGWNGKAGNSIEVRPVSKFDFSTLKESFTRKIRSKKNDELISKPAFEIPDGVYILHETLGVCGVDNWDSENNDGVEGILVKDNDTKLIVSVDEFTEIWARKLQSKFNVNKTFIYSDSLNASDKKKYTGKILCQKLNSPDFPAAYRCLCYHKGNINNWYLPSIQELHTIAEHRHEIQEALIKVNGDILKFSGENVIILKSRIGQGGNWYWSSTEAHKEKAWSYNFDLDRDSGWTRKSENSFQVRPVAYFGEESGLKESFTRKIRSKKNDELTTKADTAFVPDGVYILHETLGVRTVDSWNPEDNEGVVGILLIEDNHRIVVALEDSPKDLLWSKERKLVNKPVEGSFIDSEDAESDFNGEYYCQNLNSPDFPAAYYCLNYKKGGRNWYLPSSGELLMIYNHFEEIQNALSIVGGQKFITKNDDFGLPAYWSSTEGNSTHAWFLSLEMRCLDGWFKDYFLKVRPVSKFSSLKTLKESFTRKISQKKNDELISKPSFVLDNGVYILHETLGVKTVDGWNPKDNDGVVGILLIEDEHQIVIALEVSPKNLIWSEEYNFVNRPIKNSKTAKSDFNGEKYCRKLNSPDFPAAYYCLNYKKGGRDWHLPSMGELWLIRNHLEEIQTAASTVGGQRSVFTWDEFAPCFWSSTERDVWSAWVLNFGFRGIPYVWYDKVGKSFNVLPISKFQPSELKESFTKKISSKKNTDLISKPSFVPDDGVYIFHKTLGLKTIDEWDRKDNLGVVGILVVQDEHQIVISLTDFLQTFHWAKEKGLVNKPIYDKSNAWSDFNGEEYCKKLNSKDFPAAYFCINYGNYRGVWSFDSLSAEEMAIKADYNWYLPSAGEMGIIYKNLNDVQLALRMVGGYSIREEFYLSSSEVDASNIWKFNMYLGELSPRCVKTIDFGWVRPVFKFNSNFLKESFTKKIKKSSNKDLVDIADKLASTNYDYNEVNFTRKLRKETEEYYKSEFYKVYHFPLDYRYNGDVWPANEDGFHNMYLESTYYTERNEEVSFEGYFNDNANNCAEPADVGIFVFGYGKDCVAYGEYEEYSKTHQLTESFTAKTKNKTNKDLQNKSNNVFNLDNLLKEYVKSHCRPGSHNYDFYFSEENRPVFSDKEWKKLQGITVVKEIDDYYPSLHVVTPHGSTISNDFLPNVDDVFLFYIYRRRKFHIPVNRLPEKLLQELMEWILNINESFTRKTKQKSTEDLRQKADEHIGFKNLVKEIVLENDSFKENDKMSRLFRNRQPRCTHALNKLRVRPTSDPTLSPYEINRTVVLDKSFYFKPEKYNISSLLAKDLTRKAMKDLYNSDSIIVLNRIYTMEYRGKEFLLTEFNILRYNERYGRYSDEMNPQVLYFKFADLPKELQSDIYSFLRKRFNKK